MVRKKTISEVREYIESFGYKLLSDNYKNNSSKLEIRCDKGHVFKMGYKSFKSGQRCLKCYIESIKIPFNEVKSYFEKEGYELISKEYINSKTKLEIRCDKGHVFKMRFEAFKSGYRCPECYYESKILSFNEVKEYIEKEGYELLSDNYKNSSEKLEFKCNKGHVYSAFFHNFKSGHRCNICSHNSLKLSFNEVKETIESVDGYELLSNTYVNNNTKLEIQCNKGHVYYAKLSKFKNGQRCPNCKHSKGEDKILEILEKLNINFERQKRFPDCKHKYTLPFDFYIPYLNLIIEYDGEQHFKHVNFTGKLTEENMKQNFKKVQFRDKIKNKFCKDNNINLLRIPYTEFDNIEEIINNHI